jgi:protein-arginine kinase activator protein McsA
MFFIIGRICKLRLERLNTDNHKIDPFKFRNALNETLNTVLYSRRNENPITETINTNQEDDCVICFESTNTGELHDCGTCKNHFHKECISRWAQSKSNCPLCRGRIYIPSNSSQLVDVMSKLTMLNETQDEKLQKVIDFLKTNYKPFFSKSKNPRKPNTNETILKNKLEIPEDKSSNQIIQELERKAKIEYSGVITKFAIEKCRKYNCWLFCQI